MELLLLNGLDQRLLPPILPTLYNYFLHASNAPPDTILPTTFAKRSYPGLFCQFLTELSLLDYGLTVHYRPSELAFSQVLFYRLQIQNLDVTSKKNSPPPPSLDVYRAKSNAASRHIEDILQNGVFSNRLKYLARASRCSKGNMQQIMLGYVRLWRGVCRSNGTSASGLRGKFFECPALLREFQGWSALCSRVPCEQDILAIFKTQYNYEV